MTPMTKQRFEFLCRRVLVPEMNKAMRRHMTSRKLLRELMAAIDSRLESLRGDAETHTVAICKRLDQIAAAMRK